MHKSQLMDAQSEMLMPISDPVPGKAKTAGKRRARSWSSWLPYLFIAPWLIGFLAFTVGPLLYSLYMSFFDWPLMGGERFVGLQNYQRVLFQDDDFWEALGVTARFALLYVPTHLAASLGLALLLNRRCLGEGLFRTIFYLPSMLSGVALVSIWSWIYSREYGLLNYALALLGLPAVDWLGSPDWAMSAVVIASLWSLGGTMLVFLAGLKGISVELYEAAEMSGVSKLKQFTHITLPLLSPVILFNLVTTLIAAFQQLTMALLLTGGGPMKSTYMLAMYIYDTAFKYFDMGYAAAMSWLMFALILLLSASVMRFSSLWVFYENEVKSEAPADRSAT
ncbi:carbohydrate ABC transporter permease [Roseateles oligotrophus]|uniref:Sugar ABC transporter permease n=1 Tax=Roseateles oligotrophus TaxID=1769250 RepID=A0ABT2YHU8_9BURK|nr:sugar ABC transporter permease [Roseateles oligotrophus]MCV2369633.1 sugar ABC transporter permease [Roseateles oligotrophus]